MKKGIFLVSVVGITFASGLIGNQIVSADAAKQVTAVGSTALQPLAAQAAEEFSQQNPKITVNVQGGGSGAGLSQVGKGNVTIGNSDIFAEQKDGVKANQLKDHKVAVVGITPVVNADVKVSSLKMTELRDIFTGKITNWQTVGGQDEKIVLVNRAQGSGTRFTFEKTVLNGKTAKTAQEQDDNGAVQKIVSKTPGAISYLAFSYTAGDQAKNLKPIAINKVKPTEKNVQSNKWPVWAYEHMYTTKHPNKQTTKFIKFVQSQSMKSTIKKLGYIPVSDMKVTKNADGDIVKK